ncbi:MAG: hypothetical protein E7258_09200 [Lachnospiraceae bacterium]|nr:hypothetical protein [Lachnospiraceae bacterium]
MYRVINEYLGKVNLQADAGIYSRITDTVKDISGVNTCTVTVNFKRYVVDIRLKKYTVDSATDVFREFERLVSYPYSSVYVRYNEGGCIRYRYATCKENKEGFYCDIVIS